MDAVQLSENARHLSRAGCIIECGMRFHGNYKDTVNSNSCLEHSVSH
jgi:hypothetical protein